MKRCKFLTLMLALLLLLQSSALAADKGKTVTVTLPTFAVTLNDTKIDSAHSEYPLIVYRDITYFPMTYHASRFLHLKSNWYQTEPKGTLFVGYSDASEDTWTDKMCIRDRHKGLETAGVAGSIAVAILLVSTIFRLVTAQNGKSRK